MRRTVLFVALAAISLATACGPLRGSNEVRGDARSDDAMLNDGGRDGREAREGRTTIWEAFGSRKAEQTVQVNRYLWAASLEVLDFLPIQSVDPFTGVIVTGYGTPPGGGRSYRATIHIKDPALEARALNVALQSNGGRAVSAETARAVEDAILSRARQLRMADKKI